MNRTTAATWVRYWNLLNEGVGLCLRKPLRQGRRCHRLSLGQTNFKTGYPTRFLRFLFRISLNDTTNAFKAYRRTVIEGCQPLIAPHFNLTVEIPLKAIVRGFFLDDDPNNLAQSEESVQPR